jgi:hypothetical protein
MIATHCHETKSANRSYMIKEAEEGRGPLVSSKVVQLKKSAASIKVLIKLLKRKQKKAGDHLIFFKGMSPHVTRLYKVHKFFFTITSFALNALFSLQNRYLE